MQLKKDGYNLHLIKNENFRTILIKFVFWNKIKEDEITLRSALFNNLLFSSKSYKSPREMSIKEADLYGASISSRQYRRADYIFNEVDITITDEKLIGESLTKDSLEFIIDVLSNPNVEDNKFNEENFNINKEYASSNIKREMENPNNFAIKNYYKLLGNNNPYNYSLIGNLEDLDKINPSNLYSFYLDFFQNNNIDIIVIGDINEKEIEKIFDDTFKIKGTNNKPKDFYLSYEKEFSEDIVKSDFAQSKLVMGGSTKNLTLREKKYITLVYNIILGSSPNSKLFQNVREKKSYAYSISSSFNRLDGLFVIYAGISKKNYKDTKDEVLNQIDMIKKGNITDEEIENAKVFLLNVLGETEDFQAAIVDKYFNTLYFDLDPKEEQIKNINSVTKEEVIKLAKKIKIDTILLVEEKA